MTTKFDIPVSRNYIDNWGLAEGLREVYANAEDSAKTKEDFGFSYENSTIRIFNKSEEKLKPASLVLGGTSKSKDDGNIGQFGEGYKLALVVFLRENCNVTIINKDEIWEASFQESKAFGSETLHVEVKENTDKDHSKIEFIIEGVDKEVLNAFLNNILSSFDAELKKIAEEEGRFTVYCAKSFKKECEKKIAEVRDITTKLLEKCTDFDERAMHTTAMYKKVEELRSKASSVAGIFVGGIRIKGAYSDLAINIDPSQVVLSRDRDRIVKGDEIVLEAKVAAILQETQDELSFEDILKVCTSSAMKTDTALEKRMRAAFTEKLGIPYKTALLHVVRENGVRENAKNLGIALPDTAIDDNYTVASIAKALSIKTETFVHELLTKEFEEVVNDFAQKHMALFMEDGNEALLKDVKILQELAKNTYRC